MCGRRQLRNCMHGGGFPPASAWRGNPGRRAWRGMLPAQPPSWKMGLATPETRRSSSYHKHGWTALIFAHEFGTPFARLYCSQNGSWTVRSIGIDPEVYISGLTAQLGVATWTLHGHEYIAHSADPSEVRVGIVHEAVLFMMASWEDIGIAHDMLCSWWRPG